MTQPFILDPSGHDPVLGRDGATCLKCNRRHPAAATLTTCFTDFTHVDGHVTVEKLWYFIPVPLWGQSRFLGLVANTPEEQAMVTAKAIAATTGHDVRRMS
jgi:hypothetical protein